MAEKNNHGIEIIYEDNHLLVVKKPANMLTQADSSGDTDLLSLLKQDIKERYEKPGRVFLGMVHRLDRPAGGTMVFARTSKAASRLSDMIRKRQFEKKYLTVVYGIPSKLEGKLEHFLRKDRESNTVRVVNGSTKGSKKAVLEYSVKENSNGLSLIETMLITGRPHQIRVQFSHTGNPVYGDMKYGPQQKGRSTDIALWSKSISFRHPTRDENLTFETIPPAVYPWSLFNCGN